MAQAPHQNNSKRNNNANNNNNRGNQNKMTNLKTTNQQQIIKASNIDINASEDTEAMDMSDWSISNDIQVIHHGYIQKLPRDTMKLMPDAIKHAIPFKKRYGMLFIYKNKHFYFAFFDTLEKCRIFVTTKSINDLKQIQSLTTELWNIGDEFTSIRYAQSLQVGQTIVLETSQKFVEFHGEKRYLQTISGNQAQIWFEKLNLVFAKPEKNSNVSKEK